MDIDALVRENIRQLRPYSSARHEFEGEAEIYLDANENPHPTQTNRYPDPLQKELKSKIAGIKSVETQNIFLGNGSDEAIDLLIRIFCQPRVDQIMVLPPTYGMYEVSAGIADVGVQKISLLPGFDLDVDQILSKSSDQTKLLFICNPNNPTGTAMDLQSVKRILHDFGGVVVVDEAYIDFSSRPSLINQLQDFENLVILQTFSKAWGMAGIRLGLTFASNKIINYLNAVKPPYNVNVLTQEYAMKTLHNKSKIEQNIEGLISERNRLALALEQMPDVKEIIPSEANFLLVRFDRVQEVFECLKRNGVVVRDRSKTHMCDGCLRITIGLQEENDRVLNILKEFK